VLFLPGCCQLLSSSFVAVPGSFPQTFHLSGVCLLPRITTWQMLFSFHKACSPLISDASPSLIPSQNNTVYSLNNSGCNYLITSVYNVPFSALSCPTLAFVSRAQCREYYSVVSAMYRVVLHAFIRLNK